MTEIRGKGDHSIGTLTLGVAGKLDGNILERRLDSDNYRAPAGCLLSEDERMRGAETILHAR